MTASLFKLNTRWTYRLLGILAFLLIWILSFAKPYASFFMDMPYLMRQPGDNLSSTSKAQLTQRNTEAYYTDHFSKVGEFDRISTAFSSPGALAQALQDRTGWNLFVTCHSLLFSPEDGENKYYPNLHLSIEKEAALESLVINTTHLNHASILALEELTNFNILVLTHGGEPGYRLEAKAISQLSGHDDFLFYFFMDVPQRNYDLRNIPRPPQRTQLAIYYLNKSHHSVFKGQGGHTQHLQVEDGVLNSAALQSLLQGMTIELMEFRNTIFVDDAMQALSSAKQIDSLIIRLSDDYRNDIAQQSLEHMPALPNLKAYQHDGPFFESLEPNQFQFIREMSSLETLVFRETALSPELIPLLPSTLKELKIINGRISAPTLAALLKTNKGLKISLVECLFSRNAEADSKVLPDRFLVKEAYYLSQRQSRILDLQYQ